MRADGLARAIIAKNRPLLREARRSYLYQIEVAAARGKLVAVSPRIAALPASYFRRPTRYCVVTFRSSLTSKRLAPFQDGTSTALNEPVPVAPT